MASKPPSGSPQIGLLLWIRYGVEFIALVIFTILMTLLPWAVVWRFGRGLGLFLGRWIPIRKQVVKSNLKRAFPDWPAEQVDNATRRVYAHWGESFITTMKIWTMPDRTVQRLVQDSGFDQYAIAKQAAGEPMLLFTGHFGSWEMAGRYMAILAGKTSAIYRIQRNPLVDRFLSWLRTRKNMILVDSWSKMPAFVARLRDVGNMCIVGDQYKGRQGVTVPFFDLPSPSPKGVAILAHRTPAEVIFIAMHVHRGRFILDWEPLKIDLPERLTEEFIQEVVGTALQKLEGVIRKYPHQYLWFHKRWRNIEKQEAAASKTGSHPH
ncbi:MAG: hypothetical protein K9N11_00275 [Lentisphaeria bacterium]|nr:hypothetical protein [Candidatus Neomarinimicrobiota bacterium]MCF7841261.1 hypothetical protein [Lentisphaeria bacterium]